jgi:hypothetical protein
VVGSHAAREAGEDGCHHHGDEDTTEAGGKMVAGAGGEEERRHENTLPCLAEEPNAVVQGGGVAKSSVWNVSFQYGRSI